MQVDLPEDLSNSPKKNQYMLPYQIRKGQFNLIDMSKFILAV